MVRFFFAYCLILVLIAGVIGCSKKDERSQQEDSSMLALSTLANQSEDVNVTSEKSSKIAQQTNAELLPLPPEGPYKPSAFQIQRALKNAGYYTGKIDGKIGPLTRKAIEDFQKVNNLQVDGKVGPKTWKLLAPYLNAAEPTQ